eukprot:7263241-Pyramimonas_sp.AAC.1
MFAPRSAALAGGQTHATLIVPPWVAPRRFASSRRGSAAKLNAADGPQSANREQSGLREAADRPRLNDPRCQKPTPKSPRHELAVLNQRALD